MEAALAVVEAEPVLKDVAEARDAGRVEVSIRGSRHRAGL